MKALVVFGLVFSTTAMASVPALSFPELKIELPTKLLDRATEPRAEKPPLDLPKLTLRPEGKSPKRQSNMPILRPGGHADQKMAHAPKPDYDYKLIIKEPEVVGRTVEMPRHDATRVRR